MSDGINQVTLIGNLGQAPTLRYTQSGQPVTSLRMATNETWTDQAGERHQKTEWHNIVIWGNTAEFAAKVLSKGDLLYVNGRLQTRSWEDRQGQKRYTTEIIARNIKPLNTKNRLQDSSKEIGPEDEPENPTSDGSDFSESHNE